MLSSKFYSRNRLVTIWVAMLLAIAFLVGCSEPSIDGPYQATGLKIGEVTPTEATVWTRLTRTPERIGSSAPSPQISYRNRDTGELEYQPTAATRAIAVPVIQYPDGATIESIEGAAPGATGEARVLYRQDVDDAWQSTAWSAVDPQRDFVRQFSLTGLSPATDYELRVEARSLNSDSVGSMLDGRFSTAPAADAPARVVFAVTTGQAYPDQDADGGGFRMYPSILELEPSFFVHTGDILYYDAWAKNTALARWGWARMYSLPTNFEFHKQVPSYFMKDDHDTWQNDAWPTQQSFFMGDLTFEDGIRIFKEQVPMNDLTYRTFRWGQDLQIWLVEGRDYRSANPDPDGPEKTIWGDEQKAWFKETVEASNATFRVLISPTPVVGPDRDNKNDSHANEAFAVEGQELRDFIAQQGNMIVICGDRHWQYISVDSETGIREYASGPASDQHAGGWSNDEVRPEHRYLNVIGGFLAVTADREDGVPTLTLRHHSVDGDILNEDVLTAD